MILFATSILPDAQANSESNYAPDKLLVKFKPNIAPSQQDIIIKENNAKKIKEISQIDLKILSVPSHSLEKIKLKLQNHPLIEYVEPDYYLEATETIPDDVFFSHQWYHENLKSTSAWDISTGSPNIPIAILDSGIDSTHPDLSQKIISGYNFYDNTPDVTDFCGHGTKVAGVAAAHSNNYVGISGVAWENPIMPIKITNPDCKGSYSAMIDGIIYAADNGARVANISYLIFNGDAITDAAKYMHDKGGVVVASAGNTGQLENYADNPYIISIGGTDQNDNVLYFSSSGPYVDFVAPGIKVLTTVNEGTYSESTGTSFSAAIASGVIALLYSNDPTLTSPQVYELLKNSSIDLGVPGHDYESGWGKIDPVSALSGIYAINVDDISPEITVPSTITQSASSTHFVDGGTSVSFSVSSIDNVDGSIPTSCSHSSGSLFPLGTTTITCSAEDSSENVSSASFDVIVIDDILPEITLKGSNPYVIEYGSVYTDPGATAFDGQEGNISSDILVDSTLVDTSIPGDYLVTYNVMDSAGNKAYEVLRMITVEENNTISPIKIHTSLIGSVKETKDLNYKVTIIVLDSSNAPISEILVKGDWLDNGPSNSCVTDTSGSCTVNYSTNSTPLTFEIKEILGESIEFDKVTSETSITLTKVKDPKGGDGNGGDPKGGDGNGGDPNGGKGNNGGPDCSAKPDHPKCS